jgi:hypothetical protein
VAETPDPVSVDPVSIDPVSIDKEMALTHRDFFRIIPGALGTDDFEKKPAGVVLEDGNRRLEITLGPERSRRIAMMEIPACDVTLIFSGYSEAERATALHLFDRMFQKGGG